MRVIDLLNKIANGVEVPKIIKYKNRIYKYEEFNVGYGKDYFNTEWKIKKGYRHTTNNNSYIYFYINDYCLNDEVEIIEEPQHTEEEINEYTNKFLEAWTSIKQQFGKLFDELIRIRNDLGLNLEDNIKEEPQEHKIPEKLEFGRSIENGEEILTVPSEKMIIIKINEIIDYLEEIDK